VEYTLRYRLLKSPSPQREIFNFKATKESPLIVLGGYRSGKTDIHVKVMCQLSLVNLGCIGLEIAPTYPMLRDVLIPKWRDFLTENGINFDALYHKSDKILNLPWGTEIRFRSADASFVGITAAFGGADEDIGFDQFKQLAVRISDPNAKRLAMVLTTTPDCGWIDEAVVMFPGARVWNMSVLDNYLLDPQVIETYKRMYSEEEAQCYIHGKLVKLSGAVFHSFKELPEPEGNLTDREYNPNYYLFASIDFGGQFPVIGFYQEIDGKTYLIDEWCPQRGHGWKVWDIENELQRYNKKPEVVYGDPAGDNEQTQSFMSDIVYLRERNFNLLYTTNPMLRAINFGITLLNGAFQDSLKQRKLFINPAKCPIHLRDIKASVYPGEKNGQRKQLDKPVKDGIHDHSRDEMRYFAINRWGRDWLLARNMLREEK
jgi:hypothetical protein